MTRRKVIAFVVAALLIGGVVASLLMWLLPQPAYATSTTLSILSGEVQVQKVGSSTWATAEDNMVLEVGDRVKTGPDSYALLTFFEGSTMELEPNSEVVIEELTTTQEGSTVLRLKQQVGRTWNRVEKLVDPASRYEVDTPTGVAVARDTLFDVEVAADGTTNVRVIKDKVTVTAQQQEVTVEEGNETVVLPDNPPAQPTPIPAPKSKLQISVSSPSPAWLQVVDPIGRSAGIVPPGIVVNQIPHAQTSGALGQSQAVELSEPSGGQYTIVLYDQHDGNAEVKVTGLVEGNQVLDLTQTVQVGMGQRYKAILVLEVTDSSIVSGTLQEFTLLTEKTAGKVVVMQKAVDNLERVACSFSASKTSVLVGETIQFSDLSTGNPTSWQWDFGDGGQSTEQSPSHAYSAAGTYTVSLAASNTLGSNTQTRTNYITVYPAAAADFSANKTQAVVGETIQFSDLSTGNPTSWQWDFGDGGQSTTQNPTHAYSAAGTYTVSLTASNPVSSDAETKTGYITVYPAVSADFSANKTQVAVAETIQFTDLSTGNPTSWLWSFGDGGQSTAQNPTHAYSAAGTYTVSLTASNPVSSDAETKTNYITVSAAPGVTVVSSDGWGWQNPLPQGNNLRGVWGSSSTDVFAVGAGGTILHYNGSTWIGMTSSTANNLYGIWGSSSSDVFAVGASGTILHYNGSNWSAMTSGTTNTLRGVWGSSASNVFAVGHSGTILHYDGSNWSVMTSGTTNNLYGIWGSSSSDVFAVGASGTILHYDGSNWSSMTSGTTNALQGVWGSSASDVFAVGYSGTILHYDGSTWSAMTSGTTEWLCGVWGSSATDVFAVGGSGTILHYDGSTWSAMSSGTTKWLYGIWGSSASDVFAVGDSGIILHYDGSTWSAMSSGSTWWLYGVWGSSSTDVYAVGDSGTILHYDGSNWSAMSSGTSNNLYGVWGSSATDVYAVGASGTILHYDGSTWSAMSSGTSNNLCGIWGSSATDVFAVGELGTIRHYDGSTWSAMTSGTTQDINGVWGSSSTDVFAVDRYGTILHYNGSTWSMMTSGTLYQLEAIWGSSATDVFAVGESGTILHYLEQATAGAAVVSSDGWGWQNPLPQGNTLRGVWGSSSSDVFAVGYSGTILHYNGSTWIGMASSTTNNLLGVWGSSSTDVFAVGQIGTILHYDGSNWSAMTSGTTNTLNGVWGSSSSDVFAVENSGTILHYDGSTWSAMTSGTTNNLLSVWGSSSNNVFAVGASGTILHYDGSTWSSMTSGTSNPIYGIWGSSSTDVFAVGQIGTILHYDGSNWSAMTSGSSNNLLGIWGSSATDAFAIGYSGTILHYNGSTWSSMSSGTSNHLYDIWGSSAPMSSPWERVAPSCTMTAAHGLP